MLMMYNKIYLLSETDWTLTSFLILWLFPTSFDETYETSYALSKTLAMNFPTSFD